MGKEMPVAMGDTEYASKVISALDSPLRVDILLLLHKRDHVVHELVSTLSKSQPLISQHLRVLKKAGLVQSTRTGREVVYSLSVPETIDLIRDAEQVGKLAQQNDELAARREAKKRNADAGTATGAAAIIGVPQDNLPARDPGLIPQTPSPKK
ncbi:cadmium efflux system accessory protein [Corynebacterium pilosum]|uniref:Cadmium efflux system accessory protein n=3 Tax=Corynebacterium pilosum TaxID=35756 RepID=A0A376CJA7_9CORY|nr:cadmium efflux system accessory protein [Corynebacterium pilosum]